MKLGKEATNIQKIKKKSYETTLQHFNGIPPPIVIETLRSVIVIVIVIETLRSVFGSCTKCLNIISKQVLLLLENRKI